MKKSTLFFKVMVLLAMLVPWTSWGQSQLPSGIEESDVIADKIMVLDSNGEIPGDNSGATDEQKGKNVKLETFHFKTGYDYNDWTFVNEVKPSDSGITVKTQGGNTMLSLSGSPKSEVDAIYIKIKNTEGDEKWVRYGFVQSGSSVISASYTTEDGSKVYNGRNISEEEVKVGLKVVSTKYEIGQDNEETTLTTYSVTIPDNAKNVGTYEITITANGSTATVEYKITKRPITIVVKDDAKLEYTIGDVAPAEFKAEDYLTVADGTDKSGLVGSEIPTFTGNLTVTGFSTEKAGTFTIKKGEADITDNESTGFKKDNYNPTWNLTDAKITVKTKTVDPEDITLEDENGNAITDNYSVEYDGKEHGVAKVKIGGTILDPKDYTVTYDGKADKPVDVKLTDDENEEVVAYTITISLDQD